MEVDVRSSRIIKRLPHIIELEKELKSKYGGKVPSVPIRKESEINEKNERQVLEFFEVFLNMLSKNV